MKKKILLLLKGSLLSYLFNFFALLFLVTTNLNAQSTISFDDQGFGSCQELDDNHSFSANGKTFRIYAANFDRTPSSEGSLWYETASGGCWHNFPTVMGDGGYITAGYATDVNMQWYHPQALVVKTSDGSEFKFTSFKAHDAGWHSWGNYLKVSGYKDGVLQGTENVTIVSDVEPYYSTVTLTNALFENVDEVRITMDKENNPDFGNPEIVNSNADGLFHSFDTFVVDNASSGTLLSSSPTISFSGNSGFTNNIAEDGQGGSTAISDINIQIYPINSSAVKLTADPLQYHDINDWPGYPAIITYGDTNPHYGWIIKSDNGDDFSVKKIDFHDWGEWGGDTFVAEAFLNGSSKGTITFTANTDGSYIELANPGTLTSVFDNVDEVRLYRQAETDSYIAFNNIQVSTPVAPPPNQAPSAMALSATSVDENVAANSTVGTLSTTDPDAGNTFTYTLVSGTGDTDNAAFNISGNSLRITGSPDYEAKNSYNIRLKTTDQGGLAYEEAFVITANDVNESPSAMALSATSVDENVAANSTVGTLSTTDPDAGNTFTYTLVSGTGDTDNAAFNISGNSLRITGSPDYEAKNSYNIRLRTTDQGSLAYEKTFTITINDLNDENPVFTSSGTADADEKTTAVLTVAATDADAGASVSYSLVGGDDQLKFSINTSTGVLTFDLAPDFEDPTDANEDNKYLVTVRASDGTNNTDQLITVSVKDVNDNSPVITSANTASINENNTTVIAVTANDADATSNVTYSISGGADNGLFSINNSSGALTFQDAPDAENAADDDENNTYAVEVTATDGTHTDVQTITVTVNNVNDIAPTVTASQNFSIDENSANGTSVGVVAATDGDLSSTTFQSWAITGGNTSNAFAINNATGEVTVATANAIDRETTANFTLQITVSDGANTSTAENITININGKNDVTPVVMASQSFNVSENSGDGTSVGIILASDEDVAATTFQDWTITSGNTNGAFTLDASTGEIEVANATVLDRETIESFTLEVTVSDGTNSSSVGEVVIDLNDVNDNNPVFQNTPYTASVVENAATGALIFTAEATDADAGVNGQVQYSITGGNTNSDFAIDANTGEITTTNGLDRNTTSSYSLQITATDQGAGSLTDVVTIEITVNDVNDNAPVIGNEPYAASPDEDAVPGDVVATISATDADNGVNAEIEYSITDGNGESNFAIDSNTGEITIARALDYETTTGYTLEITASDKGIPVLSDVTTVNITVRDVNDNAPAFQGEPYAASPAEDVVAGTSLLSVSATDDDSGTNAQVSYYIAGGDPNGQFAIDAATGEITTAKALDRETQPGYTLQIIAADEGTPSWNSTTAVEITVTDVNDNHPVFSSALNNAEVAEDAIAGTSVFTVEAIDADEGPNAAITYSITNGDTGGAFAINASTGEITVNGALDRENIDSYVLEITASDMGAGSLTAVTTLNIAVTDANDNTPVALDDSYETSEDTELHITVAGVLANDSDEDLGTGLSAGVVNQPSHGTLILDADGSLTYTPDANYFGPDNFTYQADDGENTSNVATVSLTVNPVNDAPAISSLEDISIEINSATQAIVFTIDDIDSEVSTLTVSATADNDGLLPASGIALSGSSLVLTPAADKTGSAQVTISVSDGELETEDTFTLTVYPVNVAPTDINLSDNTFVESIETGEEIGTFSTTDENADDHHFYSLVSGDGDLDNDLFAIEGNKLMANGAFDYEFASELFVRVRTTDRWGETFEEIFTLRLIADPELELLIPTAITPDNDGDNDTWEIDNISLHPNAVVKVFNRDGQAIFSSLGYEKEWDGTYNGRVLPFGTYYFIIDLNDRSSRTYKGTIMIIR